ncbi:Ku protein [Streptomyces sp. NPDC020330]|uniref:non-homologous end joining protein Ku n=1 Tax=unclassified Streptomyces TaxID=2593676 RepID=UPI0037ACAEE9
MPRPLWTGAISFGLVTIPVKVVSATQDHSIHFRQVHLEDLGRVRTRKVCELDGEALSQDEIGKGYELSKEQTVPITDEELDRIPLPTAKAIEIVAFVDADSVDPIRISDSYYLAIDGKVAEKPYTLLRRALERSDKVAVAKFAWHNRERLGLLRVREGAIVLHSMRWPDEIRSPESLAPRQVELDDDEIERAVQLTDTMALDSISGFRDTYRDALEELLTAKSEGKELPEPTEGEEPEEGKVVDLMAALNASVEAAKESRGERGGGEATVHEMRPRKKTASKKAAPSGRTTTGRRTGASKKTTGRQAGAGKTAGTKKTAAAKRTTAKKTAGTQRTARKRSAS